MTRPPSPSLVALTDQTYAEARERLRVLVAAVRTMLTDECNGDPVRAIVALGRAPSMSATTARSLAMVALLELARRPE